jgi:cyclic pyranopterin phosphate synthase
MCKYCFAQGKVDLGQQQGDSSKNLSMENLEKIIEYYKHNHLERFVILGGEPTLHPNFSNMVDRVLKEKAFSAVIVFTNGIMPDNVLDYLSNNKDRRLDVALNLNSEDSYSSTEWKKVNNTMRVIGPRIGVGINIYHSGQDYDYLIEAINTYQMRSHIRAGLTHPIHGGKNKYAQLEDYPGIAEDLIVFAEKVFKNNITFSFDCGFPFCMFTLDQHKELLRFGIQFRSLCTPIVDVGPNLDIWRCFPMLKDVQGKLTDFESRKQIIDLFNNKYKNIQKMGNFLDCPQCIYRKNKMCSGGCLARTIDSFHR